MNSLLQVAVCIELVLCIAVPVAESGINECSKRYSYVSTRSRTVYYTERYTYKCGCWGWYRCSGSRRASYRQYYHVTQYATRVECCTGWRRDRYGSCSMAICSPSCIQGSCVRPNICSCRSGYTGPRCSRDINECILQVNSVLKCDHMCINSIGSYRCECRLGYTLDPDRHACNNIDECSMTRTHNCHQNCTDTPGSYSCSCYTGYSLVDPNGVECGDYNECAQKVDNECHQLCMNLEGFYSCACYPGYEMDGIYCTDIDECKTGVHDCDQNCHNGEGNFTCSCNEGYVLGMDEKSCFDIDECAPPNMNCDTIQICKIVKTGQGSKCYYINGNVTERQGPTDEPPLSANCSELQICSQIGQAYTCACVEDEGHALSNVTDFYEGDCDNADPSNLTKLHVCRNSTGVRNCDCVEGYRLLIGNEFCQDEDLNNCTSMQTCKNTPGGYDCPCKAGYLNNTETGECDDIDECSTDYMNCPDENVQICYNNRNNTIVCECLEGDINMCERGECSAGCTDLEVCVGGACTCYPEYFLNSDNLPCKGGGCGEMIHECTDMETCKNTIGGYECPCMNGFLRGQGVNATCDDIDECRDKTDGCNHLCMNGAGNYTCACVLGYNLLADNHTCAMPMSMHEAVVLYQTQGDTAIDQISYSGWLFPLGMICACALIAAVVVGRKKSEHVRNGTDRVVEMAQSLKGRVVSTVTRRSATGATRPQSNIYVACPSRQTQSAVDDEMGDVAV
ncbi:uncharacterized protein [Asterias amurensis]|uniref:uncharacterized protein n=1 Tax=Asterias amurensis TaxID=7602 RepID=UPI003AB79B5C